MQQIIITIGIVGGIASIVSLLIPLDSKNSRLIHGFYIFFVAILAGLAAFYSVSYRTTINSGAQANRLLHNFDGSYTSAGFFQAGLAFLEKNKGLYPETYERAKVICERRNCDHSDANFVSASYEMKGILQGIADMHHK